MREVRFREWETERKSMVYSAREDFDDMVGFRFLHTEGGKRILMQYTGLKDKNGREIYEGDIVKYPHIQAFPDIWRVEFYKGSFVIAETIVKISLRELAHKENLEIIGNIFEHKELLEVKK